MLADTTSSVNCGCKLQLSYRHHADNHTETINYDRLPRTNSHQYFCGQLVRVALWCGLHHHCRWWWISFYKRHAMHVLRNTEARSCNNCCGGNQYYVFWVCVCVCVALVTQPAKRMRSIVLPCVACPALSYFSTLSHKRQDFRGKTLLKRVLISDTFLSKIFLISKKKWASPHVKYPFFSSILLKIQLSRQIFKKSLNTIFRENPSSASPVVQFGRTDRLEKAYSWFSQFCKCT